MYLYYFLFLLCFGGIFIKFETPLKVIKNKYNSWNRLNKLVSTTHKNYIMIIYFSCKLLLQALYISLIQRFNKSIVQIDKNNYLLTYAINGKLYKYPIKVKRGPPPILQISDENSEDRTKDILCYLGPSYNWHGNSVTPAILGYKSLVFECANGNELVFNEETILPCF